MSRDAFAERAGVNARLVAEFERGQRADVSLESALTMLCSVGVFVRFTAPNGRGVDIPDASASPMARAARAAHRRRTWTGRLIHLHEDGDDPRPVRPPAKRRIANEEPLRVPDALGTGQLAMLLGISRLTVQAALDRGDVPATMTPGGHRRVLRDDALAWKARMERQRRSLRDLVRMANDDEHEGPSLPRGVVRSRTTRRGGRDGSDS